MLLQETKDYVEDTLLPDEMNGYKTGNDIAWETLYNIDSFGEGDELHRPTRLARNIAANREEFTAYVVEAFREVEDQHD